MQAVTVMNSWNIPCNSDDLYDLDPRFMAWSFLGAFAGMSAIGLLHTWPALGVEIIK